jgi:hypothetical protein
MKCEALQAVIKTIDKCRTSRRIATTVFWSLLKWLGCVFRSVSGRIYQFRDWRLLVDNLAEMLDHAVFGSMVSEPNGPIMTILTSSCH